MPTFYECRRCTACCRWPGQVILSPAELTRISRHVGIEEPEFIDLFTRLREDRSGLALKDKDNGECVFLEEDRCRIQAVKPQQCRDFPNLWNFPGFQKECNAIALPVDEEEYRRRVKQATGREPPE